MTVIERPCQRCGKPCLHLGRNRFCSNLCRLVAKAEVRGECWIWLKSFDSHGYGSFGYQGKTCGAHRVSYLLHVGPIPDGLDLDHLCRNRACINPAHLEPVTRRENALRGVAPTVLAYHADSCLRGHPFTPENTIRNAGRPHKRECRTCARRARAERERVA